MKIYTRTGDAGQTGLWGGDRVAKTHPRVAAYGDVDELNCTLGAALEAIPASGPWDTVRESLGRIQEELFVIGALLATLPKNLDKLQPPFSEGLPPSAVGRLEREIDAWTAELQPMKSFVLPGGGRLGAALHLSRAVCRRAERSIGALAEKEKLPEGISAYVNRLSDHLFTAARWANAQEGKAETPWRGLPKK